MNSTFSAIPVHIGWGWDQRPGVWLLSPLCLWVLGTLAVFSGISHPLASAGCHRNGHVPLLLPAHVLRRRGASCHPRHHVTEEGLPRLVPWVRVLCSLGLSCRDQRAQKGPKNICWVLVVGESHADGGQMSSLFPEHSRMNAFGHPLGLAHDLWGCSPGSPAPRCPCSFP